jgi:hypothetical protein
MINFFVFLNKYYKYFIFFLITLCLLGASYLYFENLKQEKIRKNGHTYISSFLENKNDDDQKNLSLIENENDNFGLLAKLSIIQNLIAKSNLEEAKTKLKQISENKKFDNIFRHYAIYLYSQILISEKKFVEFDQLIEKENILSDNSDFVFKDNIFELIIISYKEQNQIDKAKDILYKIKKNKEQFPNTLFERIKQIEVSLLYK